MNRRSYYLGIDRATPVDETDESFRMYQWDGTVMDEPHPPARVEQYPPRWSLDIQRRERWRERMYRPFRTDKARTPAFIKRRRETDPHVEIGRKTSHVPLEITAIPQDVWKLNRSGKRISFIVVDMLDGYIEKAYSFDQADLRNWSHREMIPKEYDQKVRDGEIRLFFWTGRRWFSETMFPGEDDEMGKLEMPERILKKVEEQITRVAIREQEYYYAKVEIGKTASLGIRAMANIVRLILAGYFDVDPEKLYTLYHSTPSTNVESIMSRGLVPGPPHKGEDPTKPWLKNVVWMADSPEAAKHHGLRQMEKKDVAGGLTVLEIQFDPKEINLYKALAPGFFTTDEAIPPEWIRVVETVKRAETISASRPGFKNRRSIIKRIPAYMLVLLSEGEMGIKKSRLPGAPAI